MANDSQGNFWLGAAAGFFLGCIGIVLCLVLGGSETKRGAWIGFGAAVLLGILFAVLGIVAGGSN